MIEAERVAVTNDDGSKVLVSDMTLTDPKFYTQPIKAEKKWQLQPGVRLLLLHSVSDASDLVCV